ncbi:ATP-binding protein [Pseudorhodoferax sp.]|uniref:ATP-binding protein n=1 Tax=Pseudorhodoferax sp. TaxID=1993553 RepID=UPI002DD6B956|nr:adenylate/guanylate cyclase domain-containing protein [Pseudorhodoferax sp.]
MAVAPQSAQALQAAIDELESRRSVLGDALVDAALGPLRQRLALQAPAGPERRLRQVSVLFLDIVGSNELVRTLDPEDVQALVDGALAAFTTIVRQHGGEVMRYAGDSIKAAFGANGTREDDAERAVHCGLALLQEAARHGEALRRSHHHEGFGARVGIHTGPVVRGGGIEQEHSLSGLAVHIAARMEQAAAPGTLRISIDTFRQVQGRFDVEEQALLPVKGLDEPMRTYRVLAESDRRQRGTRRGVDGVATPLLGREAELQQLQALAGRVLAGGGLAAATLVGEAGLGKSRLLAEFVAGLPAHTRAGALWRASSHPQGRHRPCGLLRDLLFWHHGVKDSDSQAEAQHTLALALAPVFGAAADEQTALLGQLIGLDYSSSPHIAGILRDGKQLRARGFHAWAEYLRHQAARQPLVLVLDDLQWADDESLDALDHLVAESATPERALPLLLLCAARPELLQRRPAWGEAWPGHQRLMLAPLAEPARAALAAAMLQRLAQPAPRLQALLAAQAAGNPYYMEALLQMLVDTGVIRSQGEHWVVQDERLQALQVPPTLVGVLQATLDALTDGERLSLQQASVVGALFWDQALAAIDPQATAQLPALSQRELALPQSQSTFEGAREYNFRHHLLHQVTYGTVLRADKREGHRRAALWLQSRSGERQGEMAGQIAEHFERAGEHAQAIHHWLHAAEDASRREADSAALAHADRGLALDDGSDLRRKARLHRVRSQVYMRASLAAEHAEEVAVLQQLADQLSDEQLHLTVATDRMWRLFLETRFEEAVALGAQRLAGAAGRFQAEAARVHNVMFIALSRLGRADEGLAHGHQGLESARAVGDMATQAAIHNNIGVNLLDRHDTVLAQSHLQQALDAYELAGSRYGVMTVYCNLALSAEQLCDFEKARALLLLTLKGCREIGARGMEAMAQANLSSTLIELGETEAAFDSAQQGIRLAHVTGDRWALAHAHGGAAMAAFNLTQWPQALEHARAAQALFADHGHVQNAAGYQAVSARVLAALGDAAEALRLTADLLAGAEARGGWGDFIDAPAHLHRVLAPRGDARAPALLQAAHGNLQRLADTYATLVPRDTFLRATVLRREVADAWAAAQAA